MGFFKKILRNKIFRAVAPIILGSIPVVGPYLGAAAGGYLGSRDGGGIIGGLTGAAGGYFGGSALSGAIGGGMAGAPLSGIGPTAPGGLSGAISGATHGLSTAAGALGLGSGAAQILNTVSSASGLLGLGGAAVTPQKQTLAKQAIRGPTTAAPFVPKKPDAMARPESLNELASFSPEQERSALATRGLNTGLGGVEQSYYRNLLQRSLIGDGGQVANANSLMPIESSYFSRQGKNTSDILKFLQGIA